MNGYSDKCDTCRDVRMPTPHNSTLELRAILAGLAMQGLTANPNYDWTAASTDIHAVRHADALIAELAKSEPASVKRQAR